MSVGRRIDSLLAGMAVVAEGKASSLTPSISGGERDFSPRSTGDSMHDEWAGLFARLADLAEVDAERFRGGAAFRPSPREDRELRNARILVFEDRHSLFVAYVTGVSEDTVRSVRQKAGRNPISGRISAEFAEG